jgi:hypothetical protein
MMLLVAAAILTVVLLLLFDFCGYEIDHHPHFDLVSSICAAARGLIFGINLMAMWKLLEAFFLPTERSTPGT